jgi:hypothetical protein
MALVSVLLTGVFWILFPWPDQDYIVYDANGIGGIRHQVERRYRILPSKDWGIDLNGGYYYGQTWGKTERLTLGFLELRYTTSMSFVVRDAAN